MAPGYRRRGPPLAREWAQAASQYRDALHGKNVTPLARDSMRRQAERILMCFRNVSVAVPPPFDDTTATLRNHSSVVNSRSARDLFDGLTAKCPECGNLSPVLSVCIERTPQTLSGSLESNQDRLLQCTPESLACDPDVGGRDPSLPDIAFLWRH